MLMPGGTLRILHQGFIPHPSDKVRLRTTLHTCRHKVNARAFVTDPFSPDIIELIVKSVFDSANCDAYMCGIPLVDTASVLVWVSGRPSVGRSFYLIRDGVPSDPFIRSPTSDGLLMLELMDVDGGLSRRLGVFDPTDERRSMDEIMISTHECSEWHPSAAEFCMAGGLFPPSDKESACHAAYVPTPTRFQPPVFRSMHCLATHPGELMGERITVGVMIALRVGTQSGDFRGLVVSVTEIKSTLDQQGPVLSYASAIRIVLDAPVLGKHHHLLEIRFDQHREDGVGRVSQDVTVSIPTSGTPPRAFPIFTGVPTDDDRAWRRGSTYVGNEIGGILFDRIIDYVSDALTTHPSELVRLPPLFQGSEHDCYMRRMLSILSWTLEDCFDNTTVLLQEHIENHAALQGGPRTSFRVTAFFTVIQPIKGGYRAARMCADMVRRSHADADGVVATDYLLVRGNRMLYERPTHLCDPVMEYRFVVDDPMRVTRDILRKVRVDSEDECSDLVPPNLMNRAFFEVLSEELMEIADSFWVRYSKGGPSYQEAVHALSEARCNRFRPLKRKHE